MRIDTLSTPERLELVQARLEHAHPRDVIEWGLEVYGDRIAFVTSLQRGGLTAIEMAYEFRPDIRVVTIDTGRLHRETIEYLEHVRARYPRARIETIAPDPDEVRVMAERHGSDLFFDGVQQRLLCCHVRKVRPLARALEGLDAWFTGVRREQGATRQRVMRVEEDPDHAGVVKINPFATWSTEQIDAYLASRDVPQHPLHGQGYASIGCAPCTRPILPGEDQRAGRWWWEDEDLKECGLHHQIDDAGLDAEIARIVTDARDRTPASVQGAQR